MSKSDSEPRWLDSVELNEDWEEKEMAKFEELFVIDDSGKI